MSTALYPQTPHCYQHVAWTPVTCDPWEKGSNRNRGVVGTGRPIQKDPTLEKKKSNPLALLERQIPKYYLCHTRIRNPSWRVNCANITCCCRDSKRGPWLPDQNTQRANAFTFLEQLQDLNHLLWLCTWCAQSSSSIHTVTHSFPLSLCSVWQTRHFVQICTSICSQDCVFISRTVTCIMSESLRTPDQNDPYPLNSFCFQNDTNDYSREGRSTN